MNCQTRPQGLVRAVATTTACLTFTALGITSATGIDDGTDIIDRIAADVATAAPEAHVTRPTVMDDAFVAHSESGVTAIPENPMEDIVVTPTSGLVESFGVSMPSVPADAVAKMADDGTVVYASAGSPVSLAVQALPHALRAAVVLVDSSAPERYSLTFEGLTPTINPDGSVTLSTDSQADVVLEVASLDAPWARDATGTAVPTHYEVAHDTVIQVVDHVAHGNYAYPIVADPTVQYDCGSISCTVRWNRTATRNIRDGSLVGAGITTIAAAFVAPVAIIAGFLAVNGTVAGRYYENGNCFGAKVYPPTLWYPTQVKRGTYNCS